MKIGNVLYLATLGILISISTVFAQGQRKADKDTENWRYEIEAVGVGTQGTYQIKVWSYSKVAETAIEQSKKNAIHGVIFKGFAPIDRVPGQKALVLDSNVELEKGDYFESFFENGGRYMKFVSLVDNGEIGPGDRIKIGKEFKIGVVVSVNIEDLRKELEKDNIIKSLSNAITGKKPSIMVVPKDQWCLEHNFTSNFDNQGKMVVVPDYKRALQTSSELGLVITKINELMTSRGFPLVNLETMLKKLENDAASEAMTTLKDGGELSESPTDKLKKTAKADIIIDLGWTVNNPQGPRRSITFTLAGNDSFSGKQIAGASGTGQQTFTSEISVLLEEAILSYLDRFNVQLLDHFTSVETKGREMSLKVRKSSNFDKDLESEFDGKELLEIIEDWVRENSVQGNFSLDDQSENMMNFSQVMVPVVDAKNRKLDAYAWGQGLRKMLKDKYALECKLVTKGLGEALITLGSK
ncbi:DUF6175 family protein [Aquirufa sp. OSTEICH-129V]|uniref:DUF6175 family protein n=1 Tax=Aquirufa avitistagni TaxID=3104728 RepID=A0ABW6DDL6_9BACT